MNDLTKNLEELQIDDEDIEEIIDDLESTEFLNLNLDQNYFSKDSDTTYFVFLYEIFNYLLDSIAPNGITVTYEGFVDDLYCLNYCTENTLNRIKFLTEYGDEN